MKIYALLFSFALSIIMPAPASALEVSPAIKVLPLLTATASWNGAPSARR